MGSGGVGSGKLLAHTAAIQAVECCLWVLARQLFRKPTVIVIVFSVPVMRCILLPLTETIVQLRALVAVRNPGVVRRVPSKVVLGCSEETCISMGSWEARLARARTLPNEVVL